MDVFKKKGRAAVSPQPSDQNETEKIAAWRGDDAPQDTTIQVVPAKDQQPKAPKQMPKFQWSAGWAMFGLGMVCGFPLLISMLLPVVSKKKRGFNNQMAAVFSAACAGYVLIVAAICTEYFASCTQCNLSL